MKAATPKVSVVMSSYNHAAYVGQAIESVLSQTYGDFEFLVTDDGSTDGTQDVIASYSDPRLHFAPLPKNVGAAAAYNTQIERAQGEYVAIGSSDDVWLPDKLEYQVALLDRLPQYGASFGQMSYIDLAGSPYQEQPRLVERDIDQPAGWHLRRFMASANGLNHPTSMIRRTVHDQIGLYDNRFRQMFDFDLWIRLVKHCRIHVSARELVRYRWQPGHNTSAQGGAIQANRDAFEYRQLAETMLASTSRAMLLQGFGDLVIEATLPTADHVDIERALLHLRSQLPHGSRQFGAQQLFDLLGIQPSRSVLETGYHITDLDLHTLTGDVNAGAAAFAALPEPASRNFPVSGPRDPLATLSERASGCVAPPSDSGVVPHPVAEQARIPCVMLAFKDIAATERTLLNLAPLKDRLDVIVVENPSDASEDMEALIVRFMTDGLVSRYFRFDQNIRADAIDTVLRRELQLDEHPYVIATDADLEANTPSWLDEKLHVMETDPLVFAMGMTLDPSNLPEGMWIGNDLVGDRGDYIETTTGNYFLMFRGPELATALDYLNRSGKHFLDEYLHQYCYGVIRRRWARTKHSQAYHIAWDYYADPEHPYTKAHFTSTFQEHWFVRRYAGYEEFRLGEGWRRRDISDDPGELFQRSLDSFSDGNLELGALACDRLLCLGSIRNEYREKTHENLRFYAQPLATLLPGGEVLEINRDDAGGQLTEATIAVVGDGLAVVVQVPTIEPNGGGPNHEYWVQRVSPELALLGDPSLLRFAPSVSSAYDIDGLRLVRNGSRWNGTAMVKSHDLGDRPSLSLVSVDFNRNRIDAVQSMGDSLTRICEPGGMPVEVGERLHVVQRCGPTVVLRHEEERRIFSLSATYPAPRLCEWFVAGTQLEPVSGGYLAVVREIVEFEGGEQDLHRLVRFSQDLRIVAMSHAFTIQGYAAERCSGLAVIGRDMYLAYTIAGTSAMLAKLDLAAAMTLLSPVSRILSEGSYTWPSGCGMPAG